jgi:hypothetical protein
LVGSLQDGLSLCLYVEWVTIAKPDWPYEG